MRWVARGVAGGILVVGWTFVLWQNRFHVTTPVVMVCLAYLAVVAIVFNMYRTGASAVAENAEDDGGASWGLPIGARGELEREKRTLLKAIKEAEFDQAMGKLSKQDADDMIRTIRARAIAVIKELDNFDAGNAGSVRDRIEREVRARLVVASAVTKLADKKVAEAKPADAKPVEAKADDKKPEVRSKKRGKNRGRDSASSKDADAKADAKTEAAADAKSTDAKLDADATSESKTESKADAKTESKADAEIESKADAKTEATADAKTEAKLESKADANDDSKHGANADAEDLAPPPGDDVKREEVRS